MGYYLSVISIAVTKNLITLNCISKRECVVGGNQKQQQNYAIFQKLIEEREAKSQELELFRILADRDRLPVNRK